MGMGYMGRHGTYHLNWSGHSTMAAILDQLGADLTEWSGSNDGDRVSAKTCRAWASLLEESVGKVMLLEQDDPSYMEGKSSWPVVIESAKYEPDDPNRKTAEVLDGISGNSVERATKKGLSGLLYRINGKLPERGKLIPLPEDFKEWILEFATYLKTCGGCRQC